MNATPRTSNQLAEERTGMALGRTMMALERTLMAWLRTAVALISFGFTIYKVMQGLQEKGQIAMREHAPRNLGLFLIFFGMGLLILGIFQYRIAKKNILGESGQRTQASLAVIGSICVLLVGLFTILNIFFGLGGF